MSTTRQPDYDYECFGVEEAAARLVERLERIRPDAARLAADGRPRLWPPFSADRDRVDGPVWWGTNLVVFGSHAARSSRPLGRLLTAVREQHIGRLDVAWRHRPDPLDDPRTAIFALAAEAAAVRSRFWALTRELLALRHHDPVDLRAAMVRADLDPRRCLATMRAGTGSDRIVADVASALASGVSHAPALFIDGERYDGELEPAAVTAALEAVAAG